jgi:Flp pilus assembly protein TadG
MRDRAMAASTARDGTPRRRFGRRFLRPFLRDRRGAVGVEMLEFALIGPVFLALLGAILETALAFWSNQILDTALADAARQLYTGQFQNTNKSTTDVTQLITKLRSDALCKVDGQARATIFTCSNVKIDVRKVSQFSGTAPVSPVDPATKDWRTGFGTNYATPAPGDIIIIQAAVKFPVFFTLWNPNQASFSDGSRLLQAATIFRTEPY